MLLVLAVAAFYSFVVLDNTTDYNSNYQFVRHVLMMDSTLPGNHAMWRALKAPAWHTLFYASIITWEAITMILCWWGGFRLMRALRGSAEAFNQSKRVAIAALACALLMWMVAFLARRRRVVPHVAVENLERRGRRLPRLRRHRYHPPTGGPARHRIATLAPGAVVQFESPSLRHLELRRTIFREIPSLPGSWPA